MELIFLEIGAPTLKEAFLIHIQELIQVRLAKGDTYNTMFSKVREYFSLQSDTRKQAAEEWILLQTEDREDMQGEWRKVFDTVICDDTGQCAIFNLVT